jgi:hypothetical protein
LIYAVFAISTAIKPTYALVPQSFECAQSKETLEGQGSYEERYDKVISFVGENCYFAGNETVGLGVIDGKLQECYHVKGVVGRRVGQG